MSTLRLTLAGPDAWGRAWASHPETGTPIYVADALPGEEVEVRLVGDSTGSALEGVLVRIWQASPHRVAAPCPYFGPPQPVALPDGSRWNPQGEPRCAGCSWQHVDYGRQLPWKRAMVVARLAETAQWPERPRKPPQVWAEELVADPAAMGDPDAPEEDAVLTYAYATQMRFLVDEAGRLGLPARIPPGASQAPAPVPVQACLLHHPQLDQLFQAFQVGQTSPEEEDAPEDAVAEAASDEGPGSPPANGRQGTGNPGRSLRAVRLAVGATGPELRDDEPGMVVLELAGKGVPEITLDVPANVVLYRERRGDAEVELLVGGWTYPVALGERRLAAYPPLGERPFLWPHAVANQVMPYLLAQVLELQPFEHVLDVWAGFGVVTVALAEEVGTVVALEEDPLALPALEQNLAGLDNVALHAGPPLQTLKRMHRKGYRADVAIIHLPGGVPLEELVPPLYRMGVVRIGVVTEDVAAVGRAVAPLRARSFRLHLVQPVDLTPHQPRVTVVARFDRHR